MFLDRLVNVITGASQTQQDVRSLAKAQPRIEEALERAETGARQYATAQLTLQLISTAAIASIALMAISKCFNRKG